MSKYFKYLWPIQVVITWIVYLPLSLLHLIANILNRLYEAKADWSITPKCRAQTHSMTPWSLDILDDMAEAHWKRAASHLLRGEIYYAGSPFYEDNLEVGKHSYGHLCYLHGLALACCFQYGECEEKKAMMKGTAKFVTQGGTMVRTPAHYPFNPPFSQDMVAGFLVGVAKVYTMKKWFFPENVKPLTEAIERYTNRYIKDGYCAAEDSGQLSPRCRHTPGINYNPWDGDKWYEKFHYTTGVGAAVSLSTLLVAAKFTKKWKYYLHFWFLKYICGYGLWALCPHIYLWRQSLPTFLQKSAKKLPNYPISNDYFNVMVAFHAVLAMHLVAPSWWTRLWISQLNTLYGDVYCNALMEIVLKGEDMSVAAFKQLNSISNMATCQEYFFIDGSFSGVGWPSSYPPKDDSPYYGNLGFMLAMTLLDLDVDR